MASLQKKNRLHCCGRWSAATPPLVEAAGTGDWSVVRGGAGVWTATIPAIDILERCVFVMTRVISTQASVVAGGTDTTFVVNSISDAAAATDTAIDFLVIRTGG